MAKILLAIVLLLLLTFFVIAVCCAMVVAGRSDKDGNNGDNNKGTDNEMFWKRKKCPTCEIGKQSYALDEHSEACPYISCWKDGKCPHYQPLGKTKKSICKEK